MDMSGIYCISLWEVFYHKTTNISIQWHCYFNSHRFTLFVPLLHIPSSIPLRSSSDLKQGCGTPSIQNKRICSDPSNVKLMAMLDGKGLGAQSLTHMCWDEWEQWRSLLPGRCGVCIYEWLGLEAKALNNAGTLRRLISIWERRREGSLFLPSWWGMVQRGARGLFMAARVVAWRLAYSSTCACCWGQACWHWG